MKLFGKEIFKRKESAKKRDCSVKYWIDRTLSQSIGKQLLLVAVMLVGAWVVAEVLLLLSPCDWAKYCSEKGISRFTAPFFLLIDGNAFNDVYLSSHANGWTVFLTCIIYILGACIFTGMLIGVITNMIERRVDLHRWGLVNYLKQGHYIIMGYDDTIPSFIKHILHKEKDAKILILSARKTEDIREKLRNSVSGEEMEHLFFHYGHRVTGEVYGQIHLEASKEIFIVGYLGKSTHDAINIECVDTICNYLSGFKSSTPGGENQFSVKKITCLFSDLDTYGAFKTTEIFENVRKLGIAFVPYNYRTGWAQRILHTRKYIGKNGQEYDYPSLYGEGIKPDDERFVHLVFVGTTNFAIAIANEAAMALHFPNFNKESKLRTRLTFIDMNMDREKNEFITRNRHFFQVQSYLYRDLRVKYTDAVRCTDELVRDAAAEDGKDFDFLDTEFEFIHGDVFSRPVQEYIAQEAKDTKNQYLSIFLALTEQRTNFVMGMNMPEAVYENDIPLFIRQDRSDNFITNLRKGSSGEAPYVTLDNQKTVSKNRSLRYSRLFPFGMENTEYDANEEQLMQAKLINYLYETADYKEKSFKTIDELDGVDEKVLMGTINEKWSKLSVALKWSNLYNALSIRAKKDSMSAMEKAGSYKQEEVYDVIARVEHNRWNVEKLLLGFRKPRPEEDKYSVEAAGSKEELHKNKKHNIHADIRPFDDLDSIKKLDVSFSRYISWVEKKAKSLMKIVDDNAPVVAPADGYYTPAPIDVSDADLPEALTDLTEVLAKNTHEVWSEGRMKEGWVYGPERDDKRKKHPCLIPYDDLPKSEKDCDRATALNTLKLIVKLGYKIEKE